MALIVRVYINERMIVETWAERIKTDKIGECTYKTPYGVINHQYEKGAIPLAILLLEEKKVVNSNGGIKLHVVEGA